MVFAAFTIFALALTSCAAHDERDLLLSNASTLPVSEFAININKANADELEKIPHIGHSLAERIIAHRERNGAFRRPEQLLLVQGISDRRFRELRHLIRVE